MSSVNEVGCLVSAFIIAVIVGFATLVATIVIGMSFTDDSLAVIGTAIVATLVVGGSSMFFFSERCKSQ